MADDKNDPAPMHVAGPKKELSSSESDVDFEADCFEKNERKNWMFAVGGKKWGIRVNPVSFIASVILVWGFAVRLLHHPLELTRCKFAAVHARVVGYDCSVCMQGSALLGPTMSCRACAAGSPAVACTGLGCTCCL